MEAKTHLVERQTKRVRAGGNIPELVRATSKCVRLSRIAAKHDRVRQVPLDSEDCKLCEGERNRASVPIAVRAWGKLLGDMREGAVTIILNAPECADRLNGGRGCDTVLVGRCHNGLGESSGKIKDELFLAPEAVGV